MWGITMISKTYWSKTDYRSGQPKQESYQSQAIKQFGNDGYNYTNIINGKSWFIFGELQFSSLPAWLNELYSLK